MLRRRRQRRLDWRWAERRVVTPFAAGLRAYVRAMLRLLVLMGLPPGGTLRMRTLASPASAAATPTATTPAPSPAFLAWRAGRRDTFGGHLPVLGCGSGRGQF